VLGLQLWSLKAGFEQGQDLVRADLATFGSKLMECKKTENRENQ
jgi:hypothetical protein